MKILKAGFIGLSAILILGALALTYLSLSFDADKYRPMIVTQANSKINGKLELGRLNLQVWGNLQVKIDGIKLTQGNSNLLSVNEASVVLPWKSIFTFQPRLVLTMKSPEIKATKDAEGSWNWLKLLKAAEPSTADTGASTAGTGSAAASSSAGTQSNQNPAATQAQAPLAVPALIAKSGVGLSIEDAKLDYADLQSGYKTQISGLSIQIPVLSLSQKANIELKAQLDTRNSTGLKAFGKLGVAIEADPVLKPASDGKGLSLEKLALSFDGDLSDLLLSMPGKFEKASGVSLKLSGRLWADAKTLTLEKASVGIQDAEVKASGKISNFTEMPAFELLVKSNEMKLEALSLLLPSAKEFSPRGRIRLEAQVNGPLLALSIQGKLALQSVQFHHATFKTDPSIDGVVLIKGQTLDSIDLKMTAPDSEIKVRGNLTELFFESDKLGLDSWIESKSTDDPTASKAGVKSIAKTGGGVPSGSIASNHSSGNAQTTAVSDLDASTKQMAEAEWFKKLNHTSHFRFREIKTKGAVILGLLSDLSVKNSEVKLESFGFEVFGGRMNATGSFKPLTSRYEFKSSGYSLKLEEAVKSQWALLKNTALGELSYEMEGGGTTVEPSKVSDNLTMKGSLTIKDAKLTTVDVAKMTSEGLQRILSKVWDKVPALRGKTLGSLPARETRYEWIKSQFEMGRGVWRSPLTESKSVPNSGIDFRGRTEITLSDLALNANWDLIDTYDLTGAKKLEVDLMGAPAKAILNEGDAPLKLPIHMACTVKQPCTDYGMAVEYLAGVAARNVAKAASGRVKNEVQRKVIEQVGKSIDIQGLGKKLFGR